MGIITVTSHEDKRQFMIIFRPIFLIMRNVSDKVAEEIKTYIFFKNLLSKFVSFMR